jgi:WD40 repeat protein
VKASKTRKTTTTGARKSAALYAGTSDGVHVFALDDLRRLTVIGKGSKARCEAVAISPDGAVVAGGGDGAVLRIWQVDGTLLHAFASEKLVRSLGFSPDCATLAAGSQDNSCKLWDVATGALVATMTQTNTIRDLAWCPDGSGLATICADGPLVIWNADGTTRHAVKRGGIGHRLAFSPSGAWLAASDTKGNIAVYDTRSAAVRVKLKAKSDLLRGRGPPGLGVEVDRSLGSGQRGLDDALREQAAVRRAGDRGRADRRGRPQRVRCGRRSHGGGAGRTAPADRGRLPQADRDRVRPRLMR